MVQPAAALADLTFHARPGLTTALVGPSGGGKSTILNLILRFYQPDSGSIGLNAAPLADLPTAWLRDAIAIVPQEATLFRGTIRENILYGLDDEARLKRGFDGPLAASSGHAQLLRVCELACLCIACCWDFICAFPLQLETRIGVGGIKLSGGQRQCIAIARALVKRQPAALLLGVTRNL